MDVAVPAVLIKAATFAARAWTSRLYCHRSTLARYPWGHLASPVDKLSSLPPDAMLAVLMKVRAPGEGCATGDELLWKSDD